MLTMLVIVMIMVITHTLCPSSKGERFMRTLFGTRKTLNNLNNPEKKISMTDF